MYNINLVEEIGGRGGEESVSYSSVIIRFILEVFFDTQNKQVTFFFVLLKRKYEGKIVPEKNVVFAVEEGAVVAFNDKHIWSLVWL